MAVEDILEMSTELGLRHFKTCAKDDVNVTEVFEELANMYLNQKSQ